MERLEDDRFEQFVCAGVHVRGCRRIKRPAGTRVVVVDTELAVVVVRSRQLKRRPNSSALAVKRFKRFNSFILQVVRESLPSPERVS